MPSPHKVRRLLQCRTLFQPKFIRGILLLVLVVIFPASIFLLSSCSTPNATVMVPPEIPGATYVGNKICADCHTPITKKFPGSIHARVHLDQEKLPGGTNCESCHGPASKHVMSPGRRFIINPRKDSTACFQCHLETHVEFQLPHHHPVIENKMNCVQCHDPHGPDIFKPKSGLAMAQQNENCAQCHREQARPFVFEHAAMREGCTACHNPHGSINRKMLVESDSNLCLKCHAQTQGAGGKILIGDVPHSDFFRGGPTDLLSRGTCWTSGCHSSVHGSNVDRQMRY